MMTNQTTSEARKRTGRGQKKGEATTVSDYSMLCDTFNFFFCSKTTSQRAAQDVAADAAGPPVHLTR